MATWCFSCDSHFLQKEKKPFYLVQAHLEKKQYTWGKQMAHYCSESTLNCLWVLLPPKWSKSHPGNTFPSRAAWPWVLSVPLEHDSERRGRTFHQAEIAGRGYKKKRQPELLPDWDENVAKQFPHPRVVQAFTGKLYSCSLNAQHHIPIAQNQGA